MTRRYAIVNEADLSDGLKKLARLCGAERAPSSYAPAQPQFSVKTRWLKDARLAAEPLISGAGGRN